LLFVFYDEGKLLPEHLRWMPTILIKKSNQV
jgi:hypothetical protein